MQDDQNVHNDQTEQDEQIARAVQADLDAQAAQDATVIDPDQPGNLPDWDGEDDVAMQQAFVLSRQQTQPQGSDPQAASSTGAGQSTEQELQHELQVGIDYQTEVQNLQMKMTRGILHPDDVARYRTVSKLWSDNQARVAELFDRQVQENLTRQSQSTRAILGSLKPLNISRAKAPTVKPPPSSKDSTGVSITPAPGKQGGVTDASKAPPPISGSGKPVAVKTLPQGPPVGPPKGTNPGAKSVPIQGGLPAPASPKGSSQSHLIGKIVSPRGNPPPKVLRRPSGPSSVADAQTPRSLASEATAVLEEKLRKKKEAKRTWQDEQAEVSRDDRERHKQQRSHHHQQEHRHTRDTRRRNRTPSQRSSSSDTSDDDHRSPSSRGSRTRLEVFQINWVMFSWQKVLTTQFPTIVIAKVVADVNFCFRPTVDHILKTTRATGLYAGTRGSNWLCKCSSGLSSLSLALSFHGFRLLQMLVTIDPEEGRCRRMIQEEASKT